MGGILRIKVYLGILIIITFLFLLFTRIFAIFNVLIVLMLDIRIVFLSRSVVIYRLFRGVGFSFDSKIFFFCSNLKIFFAMKL